MGKYSDYIFIGVLNNSAVYSHPTRGVSIERKHRYLVGMTAEEKAAWGRQRQDAVMLTRLEEERERAKQIAEDQLAEIGHGLSSGQPHTPTVDGMVIQDV